MIAVFVNMVAVLIGSLIGLIFKNKLSKRYEEPVFISAGIISLTIGISMAITTKHILIFAVSIMLGGITGTFLKIEQKIENFGEFLKRKFRKFCFGIFNIFYIILFRLYVYTWFFSSRNSGSIRFNIY